MLDDVVVLHESLSSILTDAVDDELTSALHGGSANATLVTLNETIDAIQYYASMPVPVMLREKRTLAASRAFPDESR